MVSNISLDFCYYLFCPYLCYCNSYSFIKAYNQLSQIWDNLTNLTLIIFKFIIRLSSITLMRDYITILNLMLGMHKHSRQSTLLPAAVTAAVKYYTLILTYCIIIYYMSSWPKCHNSLFLSHYPHGLWINSNYYTIFINDLLVLCIGYKLIFDLLWKKIYNH